MSDLQWSFYKIWNQSLEQRPERKDKPRETIWASEVGGSMIDLYLKFTGVKPSNPFDPRSLRKFEAGNIWEWLVGIVLKRAGILLQSQGWVKYQYPKCLAVTGKNDFVAGGKPDYEKARKELHDLELPDFLDRTIDKVLDYFQKTYPDGLPEIVLEIKSVGSYMFERYWTLQTGDIRHKMQVFHYLKAEDRKEGHVVYISKDDCRMVEIGVLNPSPIEDQYREWIDTFSHYLFSKTQPPKESEIVYQPETGRFSGNFKVGYSQFLTHLYGYKDQAEFDAKYRPMASQWNRVLNRFINDEKITDKNLEIVKEIKKTFPNFEEMIIKGKELKSKGLIEEVKDGLD